MSLLCIVSEPHFQTCILYICGSVMNSLVLCYICGKAYTHRCLQESCHLILVLPLDSGWNHEQERQFARAVSLLPLLFALTSDIAVLIQCFGLKIGSGSESCCKIAIIYQWTVLHLLTITYKMYWRSNLLIYWTYMPVNLVKKPSAVQKPKKLLLFYVLCDC